MKIPIITLTIAVLLGSSEAGLINAESYSKFNSSSTSNVTAPPGSIEIKMMDTEGGGFIMICEATGDELSYDWTAEGGLLPNEEQYQEYFTIYRFGKTNDRTFCCIASNVAGQVRKCTRVPRFVGIFPFNKPIKVGDPFQLNCRVFGSNASEIHLQWQRAKDQEFSKNATIKDGVVEFHSVAITDGGSYYCVGLDDNGNELIRKEYRLIFPGSPMIGLFTDARNFVIGGSLSVTCKVLGDEPMTVELKTEDDILLPNEKIEGLQYTADNLPANFKRTCKCTATNKFGTFSETISESL